MQLILRDCCVSVGPGALSLRLCPSVGLSRHCERGQGGWRATEPVDRMGRLVRLQQPRASELTSVWTMLASWYQVPVPCRTPTHRPGRKSPKWSCEPTSQEEGA
jgi:hypothetical protein